MPSSGDAWAFNLRTHRVDSDSGSDCEDVTLDSNSDKAKWMNELDLSSREETVSYKPNPFSIAKINAASRSHKPTTTASARIPESKAKLSKRTTVDDQVKKAEQPIASSPTARTKLLSHGVASDDVACSNATAVCDGNKSDEALVAHIPSPLSNTTPILPPRSRGQAPHTVSSPSRPTSMKDSPFNRPSPALSSHQPRQIFRPPLAQSQAVSRFNAPQSASPALSFATPLKPVALARKSANNCSSANTPPQRPQHPRTPAAIRVSNARDLGQIYAIRRSSSPPSSPSQTMRISISSRETPRVETPHSQTSSQNAYNSLPTAEDEEWCTLGSSRKKAKMSGDKQSGIRMPSSKFVLGGLGLHMGKGKKTGMSAESPQRMITFLPPPLAPRSKVPPKDGEKFIDVELDQACISPHNPPSDNYHSKFETQHDYPHHPQASRSLGSSAYVRPSFPSHLPDSGPQPFKRTPVQETTYESPNVVYDKSSAGRVVIAASYRPLSPPTSDPPHQVQGDKGLALDVGECSRRYPQYVKTGPSVVGTSKTSDPLTCSVGF